MKLLSIRLYAPVRRLHFSAHVNSRGAPTAFEKMTVFLVRQGQQYDELKNQSIPALFEMLVGSREVDMFLEKTLDDLFSPAIGVLRVVDGIRYDSLMDLPVSAIEILPNGEELLSSGMFPTQPRTIRLSVLYHPLAQTVVEDDGRDLPTKPENKEAALPEELAGEAWPEELLSLFVRNNILQAEDGLAGISHDEEGHGAREAEIVWMPFPATVELDNGVLTAKSPRPWAEQYLNGLTPEMFQSLALSPLRLAEPAPRKGAMDLSSINAADLYPSDANPPDSNSWIRLRPDSSEYGERPNVRLEVVWPVQVADGQWENTFTAGQDGRPDRLSIPGSPYPDPLATGDIESFSHIVFGRASFAHTPLEIPVGVQERLSDEASGGLASALVAALLEAGEVRALAYASVLAIDANLPDISPIRERVAALDEGQRKRLVDSLSAWNANKVADAVLPHVQPTPPSAVPSPKLKASVPKSGKNLGSNPLVSYSFERESAFRFQDFFHGESPAPDCEFVMTGRLVEALGKDFESKSGARIPAKLSTDAVQSLRNSPFLVFARLPRTPGIKPLPLLDEILNVAARRRCNESVLVTDDIRLQYKARKLNIHPMSCEEFARRIESRDFLITRKGAQKQ